MKILLTTIYIFFCIIYLPANAQQSKECKYNDKNSTAASNCELYLLKKAKSNSKRSTEKSNISKIISTISINWNVCKNSCNLTYADCRNSRNPCTRKYEECLRDCKPDTPPSPNIPGGSCQWTGLENHLGPADREKDLFDITGPFTRITDTHGHWNGVCASRGLFCIHSLNWRKKQDGCGKHDYDATQLACCTANRP